MNILFDISVLGLGTVNVKASTGVFRVVENIAGELVKHADCNITFCASKNLATVSNTLQYLEENRQFRHIRFSKPLNYEQKIEPYQNRKQLAKLLQNGPKLSSFEKLKSRLFIRKHLYQETYQTWLDNSLIHPADLRQAALYHSPFLPIPESVRQARKKSIFLTSYDLIPILYPQFAPETLVKLVRNVLKSITPETWVLCISNATRNDLLNYMGNRVDRDRVLVTHLAAADMFYKSTDRERNIDVREKYNIPDSPYILSLCTLEPRKNIEQVIRAFARVVMQENVPDLCLVLVGTEGWMFDGIFEEIENVRDLKERIIVTGFVCDHDLAPLYSDALVFVYPSFYEGFGLPPLEAMQCGTPVITSDTSSLPEVVGDAGIMVSPTDLDSLCQAILSVYKTSSIREKMGSEALRRSAMFSWKKCALETIEAYRKSLQ